MKHILAVVLILFLAGAMSDIDAPLGWYSAIGNQTWAVNESVCIHEVGHMLDHVSGDISWGGAWYHAVRRTLDKSLAERSAINDDFRISKIAHKSMTSTQDIQTTMWLYPVLTPVEST